MNSPRNHSKDNETEGINVVGGPTGGASQFPSFRVIMYLQPEEGNSPFDGRKGQDQACVFHTPLSVPFPGNNGTSLDDSDCAEIGNKDNHCMSEWNHVQTQNESRTATGQGNHCMSCVKIT